jgi:hypothetical protein
MLAESDPLRCRCEVLRATVLTLGEVRERILQERSSFQANLEGVVKFVQRQPGILASVLGALVVGMSRAEQTEYRISDTGRRLRLLSGSITGHVESLKQTDFGDSSVVRP